MYKYLLISFFVSLSTIVLAQPYISSPNGRFQVDEKKGCVPLTVTFTNLVPDGCGTIPCVIDFDGDGQFDDGTTSPLSFTYTAPGKYLVKVVYQNQGSVVDEIEIEVVPNTAPSFDLYTCNGNAVQVNVTDTNFDKYQITYNSGAPITVNKGSSAKDIEILPVGANTISVQGLNNNAADNCTTADKSFNAVANIPTPSVTSLNAISTNEIELNYTLPQHVLGRMEIASNNNTTFQQVKLVYDDSRDTIKSVNNESSYYCFRIGVVDACTNSIAYQPFSVCSMILNATAQDGFNQLNWTTNSNDILSYSVKRDAQAGYIGTAPPVTTVNDLDTDCNVEYLYQLSANYNGAVSTSLSKPVTSFTTAKPPTLTDVLASFNDDNQVAVEWTDAVEAVEYSIFRNINKGSYFLTTVQAEPPYVDATFDLSSPSCYQIKYEDACNNFSDASADVCPVVLNASLAGDNKIELSWTNYEGWQNGVSGYRLEKYTENGGLLSTYDVGSATSFTDAETDLSNQVAYYHVVAFANDPVGPSTSNRVLVIKNANLFYPRAFTPNGDNLNDSFRVFGQYVASFEMHIFNRWGELVFTSEKMEDGWDGNFKGKTQPESTYTFVAYIIDFAGRKVKRSGSIVLLTKDKE